MTMKKGLLKEKRTNAYQELKSVRNEEDFQTFLDYLHADSNSDIVKVLKCHENIWNRIYVMHHKNDMKGSGITVCGECTMEIEHARGILILINESYR